MRAPAAILFVGINAVMVTSLGSIPLTPMQILLIFLMSLASAVCMATFVGAALLKECDDLRVKLWKLREESDRRTAALKELREGIQRYQD